MLPTFVYGADFPFLFILTFIITLRFTQAFLIYPTFHQKPWILTYTFHSYLSYSYFYGKHVQWSCKLNPSFSHCLSVHLSQPALHSHITFTRVASDIHTTVTTSFAFSLFLSPVAKHIPYPLALSFISFKACPVKVKNTPVSPVTAGQLCYGWQQWSWESGDGDHNAVPVRNNWGLMPTRRYQ